MCGTGERVGCSGCPPRDLQGRAELGDCRLSPCMPPAGSRQAAGFPIKCTGATAACTGVGCDKGTASTPERPCTWLRGRGRKAEPLHLSSIPCSLLLLQPHFTLHIRLHLQSFHEVGPHSLCTRPRELLAPFSRRGDLHSPHLDGPPTLGMPHHPSWHTALGAGLSLSHENTGRSGPASSTRLPLTGHDALGCDESLWRRHCMHSRGAAESNAVQSLQLSVLPDLCVCTVPTLQLCRLGDAPPVLPHPPRPGRLHLAARKCPRPPPHAVCPGFMTLGRPGWSWWVSGATHQAQGARRSGPHGQG